MTTIELSPEQIEVVEIAVTVLAAKLSWDRIENTYSDILESRLKTARKVQQILHEAKQK